MTTASSSRPRWLAKMNNALAVMSRNPASMPSAARGRSSAERCAGYDDCHGSGRERSNARDGRDPGRRAARLVDAQIEARESDAGERGHTDARWASLKSPFRPMVPGA